MGRSSHASTQHINQNVAVDQEMRVEGMRDGGTVHLQNAEDQ